MLKFIFKQRFIFDKIVFLLNIRNGNEPFQVVVQLQFKPFTDERQQHIYLLIQIALDSVCTESFKVGQYILSAGFYACAFKICILILPNVAFDIQFKLSCGLPDGLDLDRSEEHTSELQSRGHLVCRLLLEKKKSS